MGPVKMIYITEKSIKNIEFGVSNKIKTQINAFRKSGLLCESYVLSVTEKNNKMYKLLRRVPFVNTHSHWCVEDFKEIQLIYMRRLGTWDKAAVDFFERLKSINPCCKIIYELPTYPYDGEIKKHWKNYPLLWQDKWNRRYLHKFIDRIVTLTDDKEIFGVPTLKIGNGIDVDKIRPRQVRESEAVHAIAVANFAWWHGYDRFLEGLKVYYAGSPTRKVIVHLVGHGSEFGRYQKMVADYGLGDYVILHGQLTGEALDAIYDQCNLGIASLGCYRKGMNETQELKSREYLAKGLPFIGSVKITDIPEADRDNIYLQVPNDDSPIDIEAVLNFYERIYSEGAEQVNTHLRQFAKDHFSMEVAMKEVIDFFKNGK
ncbi:MAG: glycosyltransferase family 4 protein [Butyrivibrio sp.]|nr:glycosyltransferase family 4 protein [Butyrivibrio sp.]